MWAPVGRRRPLFRLAASRGSSMRRLWVRLGEDLATAIRQDPAAGNRLEVFFTSPGLHAVWAYRLAHCLWRCHSLRPVARIISRGARAATGVEIHPAARIGHRLYIDHGMGVVIGSTARLGGDVLIYHGVTLGSRTLGFGRRHPTIGNRVVLGAGAKVLGPITLGADCVVGANAVVLESAPAHSLLVGVPAHVHPRNAAYPRNPDRGIRPI